MKVQNAPAPIGGLNYLTSDDAMSPSDAKRLDNWIADAGFCRIRESGALSADVSDAFGFLCNAVELALQNFDHAWPMDDPARGSTVPAQFHRVTGNSFNLEPSTGVGSGWTGAHAEWTGSGSSLGDFAFCDMSRKRYGSRFVGGLGNELVEYTGYSSNDNVGGYYQTNIVTDGASGADFGMEYQQRFTRNVSPATLQPRITVQQNTSTNSFLFTGSLDGANPTASVPYTNDSNVHVITIFMPEVEWVLDSTSGSDNFYRPRLTYRIWVDGETEATLIHTGLTYPLASPSVPTFIDTLFWHAFRAGSADWVGLGYDTVNRHADMWSAVLQNTDS